jgi:hypothetical protein
VLARAAGGRLVAIVGATFAEKLFSFDIVVA